MFKDISSVTFAFIYINIVGYVFHSVVSRSLGPTGYGEFMVLYSFMLTVGNATVILSAASIKTIVENINHRYEFLRSFRITGFIIGVFLACMVFILSSYLRSFFNVKEYYYFFIIALAWLGMFMLAVERSFLQAIGKFPFFALSLAIELTLRLAVALIALYAGFQICGVIFSSAAGVFIVLFFLLFKNGHIRGMKASLDIKKILKIALYVSPSGFFVYADNIFITRIFDEYTAGLFASASIVGKILLWFILTLLGVYFPKFVQYKMKPHFTNFVIQMIGLAILTEIIGQIIVLIVGKQLFLLLFGNKFEPAFKFLPLYLFALFPLLLNMIFFSMATALEKGIFLIGFHLFVFYMGFILIEFFDIMSYLQYIFTINAIFLVFYFFFFKKDIFCKKA